MQLIIIFLWLLLAIMSACGFVLENDISNETIHHVMTREERWMVFGSDANIPDYELIRPSEISKRRFRRYVDVQEEFAEYENQLFINLPLKNQELLIHLRQRRNIAIPDLKVTILDESHVEGFTISDHPTCHYHGKIVGMTESAVALSNCKPGEIAGIIHLTPSDQYILSPLPQRLRRDVQNQTSSNTQHHIIFKYVEDASYGSYFRNDQRFAPDSQRAKVSKAHKVRRDESNKEIIIELGLFVDDILYTSMYKQHPEDTVETITDLLFTYINGMQLMYDQPMLSIDVNFVIVAITILKTDKEGPRKKSANVNLYLERFSGWQSRVNPAGDHTADHWDHAMMFTGYDLYSDFPSQTAVIGVAWMGRMCDRIYSSSIGEGASLLSIHVMSHEVGHNLGMEHDDKDEDDYGCDPDKYIMSPYTGAGKSTWSPCSNQQLMQFIEKNPYAICLDDEPESSMDHKSNLLPGEKFTATKQCNKFFDDQYKPYMTTKEPFNDVCNALWCYKGNTAKQAHPALDGTRCAVRKMCFHGQCLSNNDVKQELASKGFLLDVTS